MAFTCYNYPLIFCRYSRTKLYGRPLNKDTMQFHLFLRKTLKFSPNSTHLLRTPVNTDSGHWFLPNYPIRSWKFCRKTCFKTSRVVFWSLSCYKELKLTTNRFTGRTLGGLLIQMQNISLRSSGMRRKQNFDIVFGFKSDTAVLTFTFRFLSSLLFSLFLPHFFFLLLGI